MKKGQVSTIIAIFIPLLIGVVVLGVIFSFISDRMQQTAITFDEFTGAANYACARVTNDCLVAGTGIVYNQSHTSTGNFTECGEGSDLYGFRTNGTGLAVNNFESVALNSSYTEIDCGYISSGTVRNIINITPLLFAVALLVFVGGFIILKR